jgi:radical SAM superfamily enzyme YgiQ (UPF0313 family)
MKILLISPGKEREKKIKHRYVIPQLALHILEGLTPSRHEVKIIDEETDDINLDENCDLVGISCITFNAPRAYYLASEFRLRGKKIVLGGIHPTILPDEALGYADTVVIGEAEGVWEKLLEDFEAGKLQRKYQHYNPPLGRRIPLKLGENLKRRLTTIIPVMSSRGCPYNCEFCSVTDLYGKIPRYAPVDKVVHDIEDSGGSLFIFMDDNIVGNPGYARELFKAIKPLRIKWIGQGSISFVNDYELIKLAAESGCAGLLFGLESVTKAQMALMGKAIKDISQLEEGIKRVQGLGIHFNASLVFGFDNDTSATFPETLDFLQRNKIGSAIFNILTPYPGTRIYEQFKNEGRLLTMNWKYYDHKTVVFRPRNMTPLELQSGVIRIKKEFLKLSSILYRLPGNFSNPLVYLAVNFMVRRTIKEDMQSLPGLISDIFSNDPGKD